MAITTNNVTYKDDFITSGVEDKNYLRILFKPGYSVQVRELNQLQSMLQSQIDKFGLSVWKEGSNVLNNNCTFDANVPSIDITVNSNATMSIERVTQLYIGTFDGESVKATVLGYDVINSQQRQYRVYIQYSEAGVIDGVSADAFKVDDAIDFAIVSETGDVVVNDFAVVNAVALAARFNQPKSVFFTNGSFVLADKQSVFIPTPADIGGNIPKLTGSAVLAISEKYVDYSSDQTLLDNANDTPNFTAPGADRYAIDLSLQFVPAGSAFPAKYITVSTIVNSATLLDAKVRYSDLDKKFAERTTDESGNFVTNPFVLGTRELFDTSSYNISCITTANDSLVTAFSTALLSKGLVVSGTGIANGSIITSINSSTTFTMNNVATLGGTATLSFTDIAGNGGRYKNNELTLIGYDISTPELAANAATDAKTKLCVSLEPSIAYVNGYRIDTSTTGKIELIAKKARTTALQPDVNSSSYFGNYFVGTFAAQADSKLPSLSTIKYDVKISEDILIETEIANTNSKILTVSNITGIKVGMTVTGTGIPAGSYVTKIIDAIAGTLEINNLPINIGSPILTYGKIGTCRVKSVSANIDGTYKLYVYDLALNPNTLITDISQIISGDVKFIPLAGSGIQSAGEDVSLALLPYYAVSNVTGITYTTKYHFASTAPASGTAITNITVPDVLRHTWSVDSTGDIVFKFTDTFSSQPYIVNFELSLDKTQITLVFSDEPGPIPYEVILPMKIQGATPNTKTKTVLTHSELSVKTITVATAGQTVFTLDHTSIVSIDKITYGTALSTSTDITNDVILLSDGQMDNYYTKGKIQYIGTSTLDPSQNIYISYTYFAHGATSDAIYPFYTVNSYKNESNGPLEYEEIPVYNGIGLSDMLDFRPLLLDVDDVKTDIYPPAPNGAITLNVEYYLPRTDVLTVNNFGKFSLVEGVPSIYPIAPAIAVDSMALYTLNFNAYTFSDTDLVSKMVDNKRYTMQDIGKLDKRISNLEYYTSLSLLERAAKDTSIINTIDGSERLKNGIVTDNFVGHGIGNVNNIGYKCAIDPVGNTLHPTYNINNIGFTPNASGTNVSINDNTVTLAYTEVPLITQILANDSISVNPYNKAVFIGNLEISPSTDEWIDTQNTPDILVNDTAAYDAMVAAAGGITGTYNSVWSSWTTNWKGQFYLNVERAGGHMGQAGKMSIAVANNAAQPQGFTAVGIGQIDSRANLRSAQNANFYNTQLGLNSNEYKLALAQRARENTGWASLDANGDRMQGFDSDMQGDIENQIRTATQITLAGSYTTSVTKNTKIIDTSIIPYMRSRVVYFRADSLFGGRTVYPFFDGIDVSKYCAQVTEAEYKLWKDRGEVTDYTGVLPTDIRFAEAMTATALVPDKIGQIFGKFLIPNNALQKFKCGTRKFRLSDSIINDPVAGFSLADVDYTATGILLTKETTITSTRNAQYSQRTIADSRNLLTNVQYHEPVAQSFLIGDIEGGTFVTSVDIFFQSIGTTAPIELHLVAVENGYPTQRVVPFSRVVLKPEQVKADMVGGGKADSATKFKFSDPVYLKKGVEYAIVLISNDDNYRVWIATVSTSKKDILTGNQVSSNPYNGVFFKSANASTWTADQSTDLKFIINRAQFDTSKVGSIRFNSNVPTGIQKISINDVDWPTESKNDYGVTPAITIAPPFAGGITATANAVLNGATGRIESFVITNPGRGYAPDEEIEVSITPNGGLPAVEAKLVANTISIPLSLMNLSQESVVLDGTALTNNLTYVDNDLNENRYANNIVDGQNVKASAQTTIRRSSNLYLESTLYTSDEYLTPVIDIERHSILLIQNVINNDFVNEEIYDSGKALARYITKTASLSNPSTKLDIYVSVNRPSSRANIKVYAKLKYDGATPASSWIEIKPTLPIDVSSNDTQFSEVHYSLTSTTNDFIEFTTKIVMLSPDIINVPTLRDFRAIATSV